MKSFGSRLVSTSFFAVAISLLLVGVVWASSAALRTTETAAVVGTTTLPDSEETDEDQPNDGDVPDIEPDDGIAELRQMVEALSQTIENLTGIIEDLEADLKAVESLAVDAATKADGVASTADEAALDASDARRIASEISSRVDVVEAKTSQFDSSGLYTGKINPNQLSRKLSPTDLSGDWPLSRVTGQLDSEDLLVSSFGCSNDFRYHTVMAVDPFRNVTCVRIPK